MALIQETLREIVRFSKEDEEEFVRIVKAEAENQQSSEIKGQKTRLAACKKRLDELETLICKIYEDNALGKLPDKRYQILDAQYAKEQESLEAEATSLQKAVDEYESGQKSADKFIALVKKYQNFEKLDTVMLNEFIYKIFVHRNNIAFIISNQYLCIHYAHLLTANIAIIFQLFIYSPRRIIFVISKNTRR